VATALAQALADAYAAWRSNPQVAPDQAPAGWWTGTVAELQAGDFVWGSRTVVVSTGATTGTAPNQVRALTVTRLGQTGPASWRTTDTVIYQR
jgi:uncharacterized protein YgiB involved in biofilm formation